MAKSKGKKDQKNDGRLSDTEVFTMAQGYLDADAAYKSAEATKKKASVEVARELELRGMTSLVSSEFGLKVTRVQQERVVINGSDLYDALPPARRTEAFDYVIDFGKLPDERRAELQKLMRDALTRTELAKVRVPVLNEEKLSQAVQDGKIEASVVAAHSEVKKNAAFIRVTVAGEGS